MPRLIALDLGSHAVKATVFQQTGRRSELEGHHRAPVAQEGGLPALGDRLVALDELLADHPEWADPANEVVLSWPSELATLRLMKLPFTDKAQIEKTLPFAVEGEVPFDLEEMVLGWRTIRQDVQSRLAIVLVRKDQLRQRIEALAERTLDPRAVYLDGEILGRWAPARGTHAVVDVGHSHTVVSVVQEGRVVALRAVDVGGWHFTRAIQEALQVPWTQAEQAKESGEELPEPARKAADASMGLLLAGIRSILIAIEDEEGIEVEQVRLTGAGSRLEPLPAYLAEDLGLPVHRLVDEGGEAVRPAFAVSHALALSRLGARDQLVQLRRGELAFRGGVDVMRAVLTYGGAALAFFLVATLALFVVQYRSLSAEQARLERRIQETVTETFPDVPAGSVRDSTTAMAIMSERTIEALEKSEFLAPASGRPPTVDLLYDLTKCFPPHPTVTVEVEDLTITPGTTTSFTAETDGYASAAAVEEALQKCPRFAQATKSGDRKVRDRVSFTVTIPLDEAPAPVEGEEG